LAPSHQDKGLRGLTIKWNVTSVTKISAKKKILYKEKNGKKTTRVMEPTRTAVMQAIG
jgi:hypothetical protein